MNIFELIRHASLSLLFLNLLFYPKMFFWSSVFRFKACLIMKSLFYWQFWIMTIFSFRDTFVSLTSLSSLNFLKTSFSFLSFSYLSLTHSPTHPHPHHNHKQMAKQTEGHGSRWPQLSAKSLHSVLQPARLFHRKSLGLINWAFVWECQINVLFPSCEASDASSVL